MTRVVPWPRVGWSIARLLFIGIVGFLVAIGMSQHTWLVDSDYAGRTIASVCLFICLVLAAATAYDVTHRLGETLASLASGARRGSLWLTLPVLVGTMWCLAAVTLAYGAAVVVVAQLDGIPARDGWLLPEVLCAFLASSAVGAACGFLVRGFLAAPMAAGIVLLTAVIGANLGLAPFQVVSSYGTMLGVERTPARALTSMVVHLGIAGFALSIVRQAESALASRPRLMLGGSAVALATIIVGAAVLPVQDSEYRPTREAVACYSGPIQADGAVQVCGPIRADRLLRAAAADLDASLRRLSDSRLPLPRTFVVARGDAVRGLGSTGTSFELFDPAQLESGRLPVSVVAATLATPRACAALFSDDDPGSILGPQSVVYDWLVGALSTPADAGRAPEAVRQAYTTVSSCPLVGPAA